MWNVVDARGLHGTRAEYQAGKVRASSAGPAPGRAMLRRPAAYEDSMPTFHMVISVTV